MIGQQKKGYVLLKVLIYLGRTGYVRYAGSDIAFVSLRFFGKNSELLGEFLQSVRKTHEWMKGNCRLIELAGQIAADATDCMQCTNDAPPSVTDIIQQTVNRTAHCMEQADNEVVDRTDEVHSSLYGLASYLRATLSVA
jgi:hypothetical protein